MLAPLEQSSDLNNKIMVVETSHMIVSEPI